MKSPRGPKLSVTPGDIATDQRLNAFQLRVILFLGRHTDRDGWCRRRQRFVAQGLGVSVRHVSRTISILRELGYLEVHATEADHGGTGASWYRLVSPADQGELFAEKEGDPPTRMSYPPDKNVVGGTTPRESWGVRLSGSRTIERVSLNDGSRSEPLWSGDERRSAKDGDHRRPPPRKKPVPGQGELLKPTLADGRMHAPTPRGTRLPENWEPSELDRAFAEQQGVPPPEIARQAVRFVNHWRSKAGREALGADWSAKWRNWILKFVELEEARHARKPASRVENLAAAFGDLAGRPRRRPPGDG
ncbi:MAG: helix-turn-helix domain-containing protein [Rhizobiales bacterium]|nr:helix-turn-helix domain-containing protein [Hyphomicrobiales bacterium]